MKHGSYQVVASGKPDFFFETGIEAHDIAEQISLKVESPVKVQKLGRYGGSYMGDYSTVATYRSGKEVKDV